MMINTIRDRLHKQELPPSSSLGNYDYFCSAKTETSVALYRNKPRHLDMHLF